MSVAGNSFEQTIGMVTAGTEIMVGQPAKVGRGLRTIAINIAKLAKEESTLEIANGKYTVSLQDQEGQMRSTYDIMSQIGEVWGELNETEQTALATQLAGKTQFEVFSNVMKNWESAVKATTTAQDSQGSSLRENARYLDSIEGKMQNFQSAWEQLSYHVVNSDMIKGFIDFGTAAITTIDNVIQKIGALPTAIGMLGTALGGLKLFKMAKGFLGIGKVAEEAAEGIEAVGAAASATGGANAIGKLSSALSILTNPAVIAGVVALGTAIAAIEFDKYFSFDSSIKRLEEYQDKLETVTQEIEELKKKRSSDEGLTDAEKTHLAVLEAEERSLQRQIELEKERAKAAFKKDATSSGGKRFQERTGPKELLAYDDALDKQVKQYEKMAKLRKTIEGFQMAKDTGMTITPEQQALWEEADKQLQKMELDWAKVTAATAEAGLEMSQYWENVRDSVPYDELNAKEKEVYDNLHKAFIQNQIDTDGLKDSYVDVLGAINGAMDSLGHEGINLFDNIDVSSLKTVEDVINAVKAQLATLDGDNEISFKVVNEDGNIEEITKKVSELTDEDIEAIVKFNAEGVDKVEQDKKEVSEEENANIKFNAEGADKIKKDKEEASKDEEASVKLTPEGFEEFKAKKQQAASPVSAHIGVTDDGTAGNTQGKISGIKGKDVKVNVNEGGDKASGVQSNINSVKGKDVHINIFKTIFEKITKSATGKRKGEKGGMSWLGDEGTAQNPKPELVVGEDGAYLAGTEGWEMRQLKSTDTVYTHAQTKKLLGSKQTFAGTISPLPMYKKGKKAKKKTTKSKASGTAKDQYDAALNAYNKAKKGKNKKKKKSAKKALDKAKKALDNQRSAFDSDLDTLEYRREVEDWTEARFQEEYANLVNRYGNNLSTEQRRAFDEERDKYQDKLARDEAKRVVSLIGVGAKTAESAVSEINAAQHLTADEKKDYRAQAYKASVEYNLKEYQNGKKTRDQILADIKNYYNTRGQYDDEYYKMLDDLREADKKKELDRLNELQDKEESKLNYLKKYAQRQKDYYEDQIKKEKEEADELERLTDLQDKLNNAKKTMIKVYREGVGFVYEQDVEAIKDAQKALDEYNKAQEESELEKQAEEWQKILDLIGDLEDLSDMKELELKLGIGGITDLTGGDIGTDLNKWSEIVKNILATSQGYAEVIKLLDKASGADIEKLIGTTLEDGDKTVSLDTILEYIKRHSFASGSLNTPSGLSLIGENGPEIGWLNKGSTIFSNSISKNLMDWGQYTPAQILEKSLGTTQSQVFNFDKIVLPNVRDADDFYKELQLLPNKAIQQSALRM